MVLRSVHGLKAADFLGVLAYESVEELSSILNNRNASALEAEQGMVDHHVATEPQRGWVELDHARIACLALMFQRKLQGRNNGGSPVKLAGEDQSRTEGLQITVPDRRALARSSPVLSIHRGMLIVPLEEDEAPERAEKLENAFPSLVALRAKTDSSENLHERVSKVAAGLALQIMLLEGRHFGTVFWYKKD